MPIRQTLWILPGFLWMVGAVLWALNSNPTMAAMYVSIGAMNMVIELS